MAKRQFQALLILTALISVTGGASAQTATVQTETKKSSDNPSSASPAASASDPVLVGADTEAAVGGAALAQREGLGKVLQEVLERKTNPWGITV